MVSCGITFSSFPLDSIIEVKRPTLLSFAISEYKIALFKGTVGYYTNRVTFLLQKGVLTFHFNCEVFRCRVNKTVYTGPYMLNSSYRVVQNNESSLLLYFYYLLTSLIPDSILMGFYMYFVFFDIESFETDSTVL